jgi:CDP-4-dehydro-6-deoxyglucose reductase, E1
MEGGMVTTNDEWFYHALLALRSHGWTRHLPRDNAFNVKPEMFSFILPGYNVRPTEVQCAVGLEQLKKLDGFIAQRRENASRFPYRTQKECGESSWFGFAVYGEDRDKVIGRFEHRPVVTGNFLRQPVIAYYDYEVHGSLANADYIHDNAIMIGNSHERIDW